jgi:transposase
VLRYAHRLHGVFLVAKGLSYAAAAKLLSESERTLVYWVRRYRNEGLAGLREKERPGRPRRLNEAQLEEITSSLRETPECAGLAKPQWTGRTLAAWIEEHFAIRLSVTHSRRILRKLRHLAGPDRQDD